MSVYVLVPWSSPSLCDPMDCNSPGPLSIEFSTQEYWSGLPFPSPGNLPDPGIELRSSALQADSLPSEPPKKSTYSYTNHCAVHMNLTQFCKSNILQHHHQNINRILLTGKVCFIQT